VAHACTYPHLPRPQYALVHARTHAAHGMHAALAPTPPSSLQVVLSKWLSGYNRVQFKTKVLDFFKTFMFSGHQIDHHVFARLFRLRLAPILATYS